MIRPYVYKLTHRETGEFYFGYRKANTKSAVLDLPEYQSSSRYVHERGFDNFDWEIIDEFDSPEDAYWAEQKLIDSHFLDVLCLNKYRITSGNGFKNIGPMSDITRQRMSAAKKGRKQTVEHIANSARARIGLPVSEETRRKMSASKMGNTPTPMSEEKRQEAIERFSKYFRLVSPDGKVYEGFNLSKFCKEHNLNSGAMTCVCNGKSKHHKKWTGEYICNSNPVKSAKF